MKCRREGDFMAGVLTSTMPMKAERPRAQHLNRDRLQRLVAIVLAPALVVILAGGLAAIHYRQFSEVSRYLWWGNGHDRHAHHLTGLSFAVDVQTGDWQHFFRDLDKARTWPPLHALLEAGALLVGNRDYRWGVLPSLLAWIATALLAFLTARRMVPNFGNLAGFLAALFILVSPAFRAYSTDIMLESLGACLTLLTLYLYMVAVQERTVWSYRLLSVGLTVLFFHKYNYWLLVVFALIAAELTSRPGFYWQQIRTVWTGTSWRAWLGLQLRQPLNYLLAAILLLMGILRITGGFTVRLGSQAIVVQSGMTLVYLAYVVFLLRLLVW